MQYVVYCEDTQSTFVETSYGAKGDNAKEALSSWLNRRSGVTQRAACGDRFLVIEIKENGDPGDIHLFQLAESERTYTIKEG